MKHISSTKFQAWRTPDPLFAGLNAELGPFDLDAAADAENCKILQYFDEAANALAPETRWQATNVWLNPPYADIGPWVLKAEAEVAAEHCQRVVMLVPAAVGVEWFTRAFQRHEVQLFDRRIRFALPPIDKIPPEFREKLYKNGKPKTSPGGGNALIIIQNAPRPNWIALRSAQTGRLLE